MLRLAALVAACGLLVSCTEPADRPTAAQETAYRESLPPTDTPVEYFLYAHCGVQPISLGGQTWHPVRVDGDATDLDDYELGTLTVLSPSRVRFTSDDIEVDLEPGPDTPVSCR